VGGKNVVPVTLSEGRVEARGASETFQGGVRGSGEWSGKSTESRHVRNHKGRQRSVDWSPTGLESRERK
jgi:hypothetical protein